MIWEFPQVWRVRADGLYSGHRAQPSPLPVCRLRGGLQVRQGQRRGQHNSKIATHLMWITWSKYSFLALVHIRAFDFCQFICWLLFHSPPELTLVWMLNASGCFDVLAGPMWGVANEGQHSRQYVAKNDNLSKHLWTSSVSAANSQEISIYFNKYLFG